MPKAKPDQVISFRIELQESERQILRDFQTAYIVNNLTKTIASNFTAIIKDVSALVAIFIILKEIFPNFNPEFTSGMTTTDVLNEAIGAYDIMRETGAPFSPSFNEAREESGRYDEAAGTLFGGIFNLITNLFRPFTDPPDLNI